MVSPEGEKHYSLIKYKEVSPEQGFEGFDAFCDENGNINEELPQSHWIVEFEPEGAHTIVKIQTKYDSAEQLETIMNMGFQEGFTTALLQLDEHLKESE